MDGEVAVPNSGPEFGVLVELNKYLPNSTPNMIADIFHARLMEYGRHDEVHVEACLRYMICTWVIPEASEANTLASEGGDT